MKALLTITAMLEAATGLALLAAPSLVASVLLGTPMEGSAPQAVARIAGVALVAIGVHCWWARNEVAGRAARGIIIGMLLYNGGVALILALAGTRGTQSLHGIGLWPAVVLHAVFGAWCVKCLVTRGRAPSPSDPSATVASPPKPMR